MRGPDSGGILPYRINRQLLAINLVHLLKYIIDIPYLHSSINRGRDEVIPGSNGERLKLHDPSEVGVKHLGQLSGFEAPDVEALSANRLRKPLFVLIITK